MIVSTLKVRVPPENLRELIQTIESLMHSISHQNGFLDLRLYLEAGLGEAADTEVCLIEEWETQADFSQHMGSNDFAILIGALELLRGPLGIKHGVFSPLGTESSQLLAGTWQGVNGEAQLKL